MSYLLKVRKKAIQTTVTLPSSKSISNRLLIMSALSGGEMKILHLSESDDTSIMQKLLSSASEEKNAGHAGTTMRFLTAYYASREEAVVVLTGTDRMKERPIAELVVRLRELGADIDYLEKKGFPPIKIRGKELKGRRLRIESGISSQYISAIMMIGPYLQGGLELVLSGDTISSSYIRLTASLMKKAGVRVDWKNNVVSIAEGKYRSGEYAVEPDWSAASYWFAIAGLSPGSSILLKNLTSDSLQGDAALIKIFEGLGVVYEFTPAGLVLKHEPLAKKEFNYNFSDNPDLVQTLVPYCVARNIPFHFTGCRTLRIKETDRIKALYNEMSKFGVTLLYSDDGDNLIWEGKRMPFWNHRAEIHTYKDHRMAMSMAALSLKAPELLIQDPGVVSKSYPYFWKDLVKAGFVVKEM